MDFPDLCQIRVRCEISPLTSEYVTGGKAILVSSTEIPAYPPLPVHLIGKKSAKPHVKTHKEVMRMVILSSHPVPLSIFIHMLQLKIDVVFRRSLPEIIETREGQKGRKKRGRVIQTDKAVLGCN